MIYELCEINHGICLSLLNKLYFISVQFMCIFAHEKLVFSKSHVRFCMFTELSQEKEELTISNKNIKKEYFTRFPNEYIQGNIKTKFGVSRKFYITYILIDKYRSYEDYSWITIRKVLDFYGYKTHRNKPKAFKEILDVLEYMINNKMIEIKQDLDSLSYDTGIEIKIISENFDSTEKFGKLTSSQFDTIMMADSSLNRENILVAFLYINSYIGCRPKQNDGSEYDNAKNNPEAFYRSIKHMSEELSMSKDTINQCIGDRKSVV